MKLTDQSIKALFRSPLWAITPEGFGALLWKISHTAIIESRAFAASKPALGHSNKVAVIPVQGVLTKDCSWCGTTYGSIINAAEDGWALVLIDDLGHEGAEQDPRVQPYRTMFDTITPETVQTYAAQGAKDGMMLCQLLSLLAKWGIGFAHAMEG